MGIGHLGVKWVILMHSIEGRIKLYNVCAFLIWSGPTNSCDTFTTINIPPYNLVFKF